jgi:hypothetical protein
LYRAPQSQRFGSRRNPVALPADRDLGIVAAESGSAGRSGIAIPDDAIAAS